jgi:ankyrin repeat protein
MLLFLIIPREAFANGSSALLYALIAIPLAILLTVFITVFIKFTLCKYLCSRDVKITLKPFFYVMIIELIIIIIFTFTSLPLRSDEYDMTVTRYLSDLSIDVGLFYFQKIFVEHAYIWSIMIKLFFIFFALSFMIFIPSYIILKKYTKKRYVDKQNWLLTFLLSAISPAILCLVILVVTSDTESIDFSSKQEETNYIEKELLRQAATIGNPRLVEAAINRGANVNALMIDRKYTVLHEAVIIPGKADTVQLLLQKGADVNSRRERSRFTNITQLKFTPLMTACLYENADNEIIKLLIDNGADINAQSFLGETALKIASGRRVAKSGVHTGVKDTIIEKLLLDNGADVNIRDKRNRTALMEASKVNNIELVKLLLDHGADVNIKDNQDKTAYMITSDPNIKQFLVNHGAKIF